MISAVQVNWIIDSGILVVNLFVELDFVVEVLLGDRGKVFGLLCVVCLHLGDRCVKNGLAPRREFLVWLRGGE